MGLMPLILHLPDLHVQLRPLFWIPGLYPAHCLVFSLRRLIGILDLINISKTRPWGFLGTCPSKSLALWVDVSSIFSGATAQNLWAVLNFPFSHTPNPACLNVPVIQPLLTILLPILFEGPLISQLNYCIHFFSGLPASVLASLHPAPISGTREMQVKNKSHVYGQRASFHLYEVTRVWKPIEWESRLVVA